MTGDVGKQLLGCLITTVLTIAITILLLIMGGCEEEVITVKERVPYVEYQTIVRTDTVEITNLDTVYVAVIRDSITTHVDTVVQIKTDTLYLTQWYIHFYMSSYVVKFYEDAEKYGWGKLPKNNLILVPWLIGEIQEYGFPEWYQGDGVSIAYTVDKQWYVKINELMRNEAHYIAIYRELGRALLNKPYAATTADEIMNPMFSPFTFTDRDYDTLRARPYLDKLFKHE